jgi:hypothetical protein
MATRYGAFLSYSHASDRQLSIAAQQAIRRLGRTWYLRPGVKIFRDEASLSANPRLWSSIMQSLAECEFFVLLASPKSARSQ